MIVVGAIVRGTQKAHLTWVRETLTGYGESSDLLFELSSELERVREVDNHIVVCSRYVLRGT